MLESYRNLIREYRGACYLTCGGLCHRCREADKLLRNHTYTPQSGLTTRLLPWWAYPLLTAIVAGLVAGLVFLFQ